MTIWLTPKVEFQQAFPVLFFSMNFSNLLFSDGKSKFLRYIRMKIFLKTVFYKAQLYSILNFCTDMHVLGIFS